MVAMQDTDSVGILCKLSQSWIRGELEEPKRLNIRNGTEWKQTERSAGNGKERQKFHTHKLGS